MGVTRLPTRLELHPLNIPDPGGIQQVEAPLLDFHTPLVLFTEHYGESALDLGLRVDLHT